jgi:hypothetical protein
MRFLGLALCSFALAACSSSSSSGPVAETSGADAQPDPDAGAHDDASDGTGAADTWTYVYTTYFGRGTPGHCGNAGCHQKIQSGFMCGTTKDTCYNGLVAKRLIGTKEATQPLVDPKLTPLAWFDTNGAMPQDDAVPNAAAVKDVQAWVAAGAKND